MPGYRFYAPLENFADHAVTLSEEESHHGLHVLRLREGDKVQVFDGHGSEFAAAVSMVERRRLTLKLGEKLADVRESPLCLTLAAALIKSERFEWMIQKAVELGVTRLVPLVTDHTEAGAVRQDAPTRRARWARIALEAAKQSGRRRLMEIAEQQDFANSLAAYQSDNVVIMLVERSALPWADIRHQFPVRPAAVTALIGPEGGWSTPELQLTAEHEAVQTTLGPRILRAETAALVAVSLIQQTWGDL